jgi:hypothetical protein
MSAARPASEVGRRAVIAATVRVSTWSQSTYTDQCRYDPEVLARATACSVHGLAGVPVMVEADVANGLPNFTIVGLTDRAIQEARERVRASIRNAGFQFPQRRLTVNLAPAEVPKEGTGFDLSNALVSPC